MRTVKEIKSDIQALKTELKAVSKEQMLQAAVKTLREQGYVYNGNSWVQQSDLPVKGGDGDRLLQPVKQFILHDNAVWYVRKVISNSYQIYVVKITDCYPQGFVTDTMSGKCITTTRSDFRWVDAEFVKRYMIGKTTVSAFANRINWY